MTIDDEPTSVNAEVTERHAPTTDDSGAHASEMTASANDEHDDAATNRRAFAAHLLRLADQVRRLAWVRPGDRILDANTVRIVQPRTRRVSLVRDGEEQLLESALRLAARGIPVFPVAAATHNGVDKQDGKVPLIRAWPGRATTDESQVRAWWRDEFHGANVGILTGNASGITIVDLDYRPDEGKNGLASLAALEEQHGEISTGPIVERGASMHLYFKYVPGLGSINGVLSGIDIKNDGAYCIAPPSFHRTGGRYAWRPGTENAPLPMMPSWLSATLTPMPKVRTRPARARAPLGDKHGKTRVLIDSIRAQLTVDDVLAHYGLDPTPTCCPLHGGDNPTAFTSYRDDPSRWHCFTQCGEGQRDGDVVDLIQRLANCSFVDALSLAVEIVEGEEPSTTSVGSL